MNPALPSRDTLLEAYTGVVVAPHPVLTATEQLARLHLERTAEPSDQSYVNDCERREYVHSIDRWVACSMPLPLGAATMHTETLGMVIDRLARFCTDAHTALSRDVPRYEMHYRWQRLAELSLAYGDLADALGRRTCRLPDFTAGTAGDIHG